MKPDKKLLLKTYKLLFKKYGPQYWWPARTPFEVMVGAVLTQNTNWMNVKKAIANIRTAKALHPRKLYEMPVKELAELIKPSGYFNIKAKRLRNYLKFFLDEYGGSVSRMKKQDTEILREQLLNVNGIGPETADSILLYALEKPVFVVDAYTRRFMLRHKMIRKAHKYHHIQNVFSGCLDPDVPFFNEFHALIVRLGVENCRPKALCDTCPLRVF
jgi:endonuclease-3 related protein